MLLPEPEAARRTGQRADNVRWKAPLTSYEGDRLTFRDEYRDTVERLVRGSGWEAEGDVPNLDLEPAAAGLLALEGSDAGRLASVDGRDTLDFQPDAVLSEEGVVCAGGRVGQARRATDSSGRTEAGDVRQDVDDRETRIKHLFVRE